MEEFITERGTRLYYKVYYDLGGWNYFTSKETPRGYYLSIRRNPTRISAFSSLNDSDGAIKYMLLEVKRQSKKQEELAKSMAKDTIRYIVSVYNGQGYNI